jgi:hypothetical protein
VLASSQPFLGNQGFVLDLLSARASTSCLFVLAPDTQALHLGGGCTLYLEGFFASLFTGTNTSGFASVKLSIPFDSTLRGAPIYTQAFVLDPMGSFAGIAFSPGLKLLPGD